MSHAFHKKSFADRFAIMGDTSEGVFDLVHPKSHILGLNRPPFTMRRMTNPMKHTPDRMTADGIYECMGMGRDRKLKLKLDKVASLTTWEHIGPVYLFVYDQADHVYYEAPIIDWVRMANTHGIVKAFENDGNKYFELHSDFFPTDPKTIPEAHNVAA